MGNRIPPKAPAIPPIPTTELTASLGNISEAVVNIFVAQAWCRATARLISATATHTSVINRAEMMESSSVAKINNAVFLALRVGHPFFINQDEKYPPAILPTVVAE